jgi:hypothetical protein
MPRKYVNKSFMTGLILLVTGCAADVDVVSKECLFDFLILPSDADIDTMSDNLAMRIDEHDQLHENHCKGDE